MSKVLPNSGPGPITNRNFKSHAKRFGSAILANFPSGGLGRVRMVPPDQEDTEFCTAFGESVSQGYEQGILMSAEYQTAKEGEFIGAPITAGADPVPSMMATTVNGSLPLVSAPFTMQEKGPDYIADWTNWPTILDSVAKNYLPGVPYYVDGNYDIFDNIRNALLQAHLAGEKGVVKAFGFWYESWNTEAFNPALKGVLSIPTDQPISRHRYNFIDGKTINGQLYLVAALTQGADFGDAGFLYMDRATINYVFANAVVNGLGLYINRSKVSHMAQFIQWLRAIGYYLIARANVLLK